MGVRLFSAWRRRPRPIVRVLERVLGRPYVLARGRRIYRRQRAYMRLRARLTGQPGSWRR